MSSAARRLRYPLYDPRVGVADDTATPTWQGDTWPTTDADERIVVPIELSLNEWIRITSSVDVGADIAYGDAIPLQFLLQRIMTPTLLCDAIASCIESSDIVQSALQQSLNTTTTINAGNRYSQQTVIAGDADSNGCGSDAKFGRILEFVNFIDVVQLDFFESVDAATNIIGQLSELIGAIPLFETLPIDEIVGAIGNTGEQWQDSYAASVNTQLLEDFRCQLWCAYGDQCDITIDDVISVILERYNLTTTAGQLNVLSAIAVLGRIASTITLSGGGTYIGDDFVYLSWLLQLGAQSLTGTFFGVTPIDYASAAANGAPNTAWTLCSCSGQTVYEAFFDGGGISNFGTIFGTYNAAEDDLDGVVVGSTVVARGQFNLPANATVQSVTFAWRVINNGGVRWQRAWLSAPFGSTPIYEFETGSGFNGRRTTTITVNQPASVVSFTSDAGVGAGSLSQIEGVRVVFTLP